MLYLLIKKRNPKCKRAHRKRGNLEKLQIPQPRFVKKARIKGTLILKTVRILMRKMLQHQKKKIVTMRKQKLKRRETKQKMRRSHLIRKHHLKRLAQTPKTLKKYAEKSSKRVAKPTSSPAKKQKVDHDDESSKGKSKKQLIKPQTKGSKEKGKASKKGKAEPAREEMLEVVTKMLKEVDFNTATLSDILQNLSDHFGVDLLHRKKEVKGVITDAISEMSDVEDEESEAGSDKEKEEEVKAEVDSNKEKAEDHEKLED
ncbi:unnamed protein product [Brassica oleracea]